MPTITHPIVIKAKHWYNFDSCAGITSKICNNHPAGARTIVYVNKSWTGNLRCHKLQSVRLAWAKCSETILNSRSGHRSRCAYSCGLVVRLSKLLEVKVMMRNIAIYCISRLRCEFETEKLLCKGMAPSLD